MRARRAVIAATAVALLGFAPVAGVDIAQADGEGAITCELRGFVVKDPTPLAEPGGGTNGAGVFGAAQGPGGVVLPSQVTCSGSITGVATVEGSFTWCPQTTDHDPTTNPHPDDPTKFNCNGAAGTPDNVEEPLYPSHIPDPAGVIPDEFEGHPTNVHVIGEGTLEGQSTWQDPSGAPADDCTFRFEGHALAPPVLHVALDCGGQTFTGAATTSLAPIVGTAGDNFHATDPSDEPATCASTGGRPDCFRAVAFEGNISAANPGQ